MTQSKNKITLKNISYNAVGKSVAFIFQSAANIILSRELISSDYGVAGFAIICVSFMSRFSGFGINNAAVHAREFDDRGQATAFTMRVGLGLGAFIITIACSGLAEHFFAHKAIVSVIRVLAFAILIDSFSLVSTVLLARKLRYSIISLAETGLAVASSLTAICLALNGFTYWSIVLAFLAANTVYVVITYVSMPYRLTFAIDRELAGQYLRYGSRVFLTGLLSFAVFNTDNFVVGSVGGATQLGYYAIAFNWGSMVCSIMGAVVFSVLFPTFSRMQDDPTKMKLLYLKIIQAAALFGLLCNVGLFCVADNFLVSVLGKGTDKWLPTLITLRILCCYGVIRALFEPASSLLMAQGDTKTPMKAAFLVAFIELTCVYPAIRYGSIEVVGLVVLLAYLSQAAVYLPVLKRTNHIAFGEIWANIWPAVAAGLVTTIGFFSFEGYFTAGLVKLCGSAVIIAVTYVLIYGTLTRFKVYSELKSLLFNK